MSTETKKPTADLAATLAERADKKIGGKRGYECTDLSRSLHTLLQTGSVEFGWRESCGHTDPTMKVAREWFRVVKQLRQDGFQITEQPVKHKNGSPTRSGGFWKSVIYSAPALSAGGVS